MLFGLNRFKEIFSGKPENYPSLPSSYRVPSVEGRGHPEKAEASLVSLTSWSKELPWAGVGERGHYSGFQLCSIQGQRGGGDGEKLLNG